MQRHLTRKHGAIVAAIVAAGALAWWFAHADERRIEAAYAACVKDIGGQAQKATADFAAKRLPGDPEAKSIGDAVSSMMQGIGGVICGAVREACTRDFHGADCQGALDRYR